MKNILINFCVFILVFGTISAQNTQFQLKDSKEALFEQGLDLIALDSYEAAHVIFTKYISTYPSEFQAIDALYYQAFCKLKMNNSQGEIQILNFTSKYPNHPKTVFANYDLGSYYFGAKNYAKAIDYLKLVNLTLLDESSRLECNFKLGYAYMNTKDFDKAGAVFQRLKSTKNKYTFAASYYLGYVNYKNELYDIAEQNLKKAAENASYRSLVPQILVNVYHKQKRYDTLIAYSNRVIQNQENIKNIEELYLYTGEAYFMKKDFKNSVTFFEKYDKTGTKMNDGAKFRFGFSLFKIAQYDEAINQLKSIAEQFDSTGQSAGYYLGLSYIKIGNKAFAFNALRQASKMNFVPAIASQSAIEYSKLGIELQKYTEVIEAMKDFLKRYSDGAEVEIANGLLSEAYLNTNDYVAALKHIEGIKAKTPTINKVYQQIAFHRGVEFFNEEKYSEAIEMFEKSLQNDQDHETTVQCYFWLGECFSILKQYDKAIQYYQKLTKNTFRASKELESKCFYSLGYALFNKQEYGKALIYFKDFLDDSKPISQAEYFCDATLRYADCLYATKKYNEAQQAYQKVIDNQCKTNDYAYLQKGINLALINKEQEAKTTLAKVTTDSKLYYDAQYNIGLIDFENTKYAAAIPYFTKVIADRNSAIYVPLALQKRAVAYNNLKQYQNSANDYQTILAEYPSSKSASNALVGLQDALGKLGKMELMDSVIQNYRAVNPKDAQIEKLEYEKVKSLYFDQNYELAIKNLDKYIQDYPSSSALAEIKYLSADAYLKIKNNKIAKEKFDDVILNHSSSAFYSKSLFKISDIMLEDKEYTDAIINYTQLLKISSNNKDISSAWNGLMYAYFELKKYDSCMIYAQKLIEKGGKSIVITNKARLYLAKSAQGLNLKNAQDLLINCFNTAEDVNGAEAMYLYAKSLLDEKNHKLSLEILFDLASKYPSHEKWIGDGFLLIADNYIALGEFYQAKATLISIVEKSENQELIEAAKRKLSEIKEN